ncbi:MAG: hypothetical protein GY874_02850 [Desulfobacteraceae bacterium]|nr:hypothetical protein [Desulfobacteraceae bacterium]
MYFIGNFSYVTDQQKADESDRRHGAFSMIAVAASPEQATTMLRERLVKYKKSSSFFTGQCSIYLSQLLEFDHFPENEAVLINLKSFAGDPIMPNISCVVPNDENDTCTIQQWDNNQPLTEGRQDRLFLEFK